MLHVTQAYLQLGRKSLEGKLDIERLMPHELLSNEKAWACISQLGTFMGVGETQLPCWGE